MTLMTKKHFISYLTFCFVCLLPLGIYGNTDPQRNDKKAPKGEALMMAEQMPRFEGEDLGHFSYWVMNRVMYPREAVEASITGTVIVSFVVEKDGSVSNVRIVQSPHESLSREVVRVVSASPQWEPGRNGRRKVRVQCSLPVRFRLQ